MIKSDFILLSGDVVSNLDLEEAVNAHKERRKVSKNAIMTLVVKEDGLGTRLRSVPSLFPYIILVVALPRRRLIIASFLRLRPIYPGPLPRRRCLRSRLRRRTSCSTTSRSEPSRERSG